MSCKKNVQERFAACALVSCMEENTPKKLTSELHKFLVDKSGLDIESEQCVCRACESSTKDCMIVERCTGLDGKFRENCVVFHHVLLCQTYKSILLPGETFVIPLELAVLARRDVLPAMLLP